MRRPERQEARCRCASGTTTSSVAAGWPRSRASTRVNLTPATGLSFTEVPRSTVEDVELALDAAHAAKDSWGETSPTERARVLNAIADAIDANAEMLAVAESWENGKPVRETLAADIPLAADHFRYFASVIRGEESSISELDKNTVAYHFREPLGVVGLIIPFNFPILMAAWKLAPALAGGNCRRPEARQPDAVVDPQAGRGHRGHRPGGRHQHRQRPGCRSRDGPCLEQADQQGRLHR